MKRFCFFLALAALAFFFGLPQSQALAQSVNFDFGGGSTTSARLIQITILITVLTLAPSILIMVTSFTRVVVVLSFLRTAIGLQQTPPNVILISLALFLTFFVMQPTFERAWNEGISPLMNSEIDEETSWNRSVAPFHDFMMRHTRKKDLAMFLDMAKFNPQENAKTQSGQTPPTEAEISNDVPLRALIPAFMISELRRAFEIGFLVFLPFLIIDIVIASLLMSMGMMMLPPTVISLPFKVIFFVLIDGWFLIAGSLVQSYGSG
ncbi:MAG: flagellar type III secretion system pore protein FliP [Alphaproteobacteria bacterium]|nr:flagellar type III secretion system pore protein FliP [Alphaproteobacteria bacterium]